MVLTIKTKKTEKIFGEIFSDQIERYRECMQTVLAKISPAR